MDSTATRAANNVDTLYGRFSVFAGLLFIYAGIIDICLFGIMLQFKKTIDSSTQQDDRLNVVGGEAAPMYGDKGECVDIMDNNEQRREEAAAHMTSEIL